MNKQTTGGKLFPQSKTVIKILHLKGKKSIKIQNLMINWENSQRMKKMLCGVEKIEEK